MDIWIGESKFLTPGVIKEKDYHYDETNPVENIHPALQGDTLEGGEHCQHKVVEVGDPKIGPLCFFGQKR